MVPDRAIAVITDAAADTPAKHVTFIDGSARETVETRTTTVEGFLRERGITSQPDDSLSSAPDAALADGSIIAYRPAVTVNVVVDGVSRAIRTPAANVGAVLAAEHVALGSHDTVVPPPQTGIEPNATIRVVRTTSWLERIRTAIEPPIRRKFDIGMRAGTQRVVDPGTSGTKETTVEVLQPTPASAPRRLVLAARILRFPRARVVAQGVGDYSSLAGIAQRGMSDTVRLADAALRMIATAYTATCPGCSGTTASGHPAGHGVVAVDPHYIPLGTHLFIPGYGRALAGDTGGSIRGNRIDPRVRFVTRRHGLRPPAGRRLRREVKPIERGPRADLHPRALLAQYGIRPKKRLGQHFLMDGGATARIAKLTLPDGAARIVEIGAGTGALTGALLALGAELTALDVDPEMLAILRGRPDLAGAAVVEADALTFDYARWAGSTPWVAAGNLPYNIATPLMLLLADLPRPPERIVVMIQRDVADRLTAKPNTAAYGSLTVAIGLRMTVERAFSVTPAQFYPRPKVDSAVVVMRPHARPPVEVRDRAHFERVVRGAFAYRRKTVANALALSLAVPRERITDALRTLGLRPEIRGEALDLATFAALADALAG